jgi:ADP-ribose pyrophosphatase YjhB (NUDIX family)
MVMPSASGYANTSTASVVRDGEEVPFRSNEQDWLVSWHPPDPPPAGVNHGSVGICATGAGEIVLISRDGRHWDFPAGRPEPGETWEETLRREVLEEACARVESARLLGFSRGTCICGPEEGRILVRAFWRAEVALDPWEPQMEIAHRRLIQSSSAFLELAKEADRLPLRVYRRALAEAGVR